jgi:hypothetical protein
MSFREQCVVVVPNRHLSKRDRHIALKELSNKGCRGQIFRGLNGTAPDQVGVAITRTYV